MKLAIALIELMLLLAAAAFCFFGFLATFEPTTNTAQFTVFRIGYAVIGLGCVLRIGFLVAKAFHK